MQMGRPSCVLVQTRLWAWQVERAGSALTDMRSPPPGPGRWGPSRGGAEPRVPAVLLFSSCGLWVLGLFPLGQALVQITSDVV